MNRMNNCNYRTDIQSDNMSINTVYKMKKNDEIWSNMPVAMAYVPRQHYNQMFDLGKALKMGTIFPELCLPFCGKRRNCSCRTMK